MVGDHHFLGLDLNLKNKQRFFDHLHHVEATVSEADLLVPPLSRVEDVVKQVQEQLAGVQ